MLISKCYWPCFRHTVSSERDAQASRGNVPLNTQALLQNGKSAISFYFRVTLKCPSFGEYTQCSVCTEMSDRVVDCSEVCFRTSLYSS